MIKQKIFNLSSWSEKLEKLIKEEQEDRVIGANIYTINTYIINTINEIKSKRIFRFSKYDIKLLTEYCKLIRDKNHILHKCRTREVNEILSLCYDKDFPRIFDTKEQHKYPVIKNLKILERSLNSLSNINESKLFIHHLTNIIIASSNLEDMKYLVHLLNEKYSIDSILNVVKKIFSEAFFSSYKSKIYDTIQNRDDISRKIENIYSQIVENMFLFIRSNNQENLDEFLKDFFYDNAKWKSVLNFLVHDSKNSFTIIYDKMNNIPDVKLSLDSNVTDNFATLLSNIIKKILEHLFFHGSSYFENKFNPRASVSNLIKDSYFRDLSNLIFDILNEGKNIEHFKKENQRYSLSFLIGKKLLSFISSTLAETVGSSIKDSIISKEMLLYSECIRNLTKEMKNNDPTYFNSCSKLLKNSLNYKLTIIDYVNRLIKDIVTNILIYQKVLSANNNGTELISNQLDYLYREFDTPEGFSYIPDDIHVKEWHILVKALFDAYNRTKKSKWNVFFMIGNLDLNDKIIKLGKVIFYDPRKWDFGENTYFDSSDKFKITINEELSSIYKTYSNDNRKLIRNSARAMINLEAEDEKKALMLSKRILFEALDSLAFIFSSQYDKFKPQVSLHYQIFNPETNRGSSGWRRLQDFGIFKMETSNLEYISKIRIFLERKDKFSKKLANSLTWYHKALWDQTEYGSFVFFWIALETLVMDYSQLRKSKSKEVALLYYIPKLTVTWKNSSIFFAVSGHIRSIVQCIKQDSILKTQIDNDLRLIGWDTGYVILENLDYITSLTNNHLILNQISLLKEIISPQSMKNVRRQIRNLREVEKFRVALLYSVRNSIFHEAKVYSEQEMAQYNVIVKYILDNLVKVLISENFCSLNKTIKHINRPYNY